MNPDRTYYFDTFIAGRLYGDADQAWEHLKVGQTLRLHRQPHNPADNSAIEVHADLSSGSYKLGYIPYRSNQPLALMLDMGWSEVFEATISRLDPTAPYDRQIGMTVKILRKNHGDE